MKQRVTPRRLFYPAKADAIPGPSNWGDITRKFAEEAETWRKNTSLRMLVSIAAARKMHLEHLHLKNVVLYGEMKMFTWSSHQDLNHLKTRNSPVNCVIDGTCASMMTKINWSSASHTCLWIVN